VGLSPNHCTLLQTCLLDGIWNHQRGSYRSLEQGLGHLEYLLRLSWSLPKYLHLTQSTSRRWKPCQVCDEAYIRFVSFRSLLFMLKRTTWSISAIYPRAQMSPASSLSPPSSSSLRPEGEFCEISETYSETLPKLFNFLDITLTRWQVRMYSANLTDAH
jgi:hypothetical protein